MIQKLLVSLENKRRNRSADKTLSTALVIFKWISIIYFGLCFLSLGLAGYAIIEKLDLNMGSPLQVVSRFFIYYVVLELVMRITLQKLPTANIQPLLVLPIAKTKIVNFYIGSSFISAFNFVQLLFLIPFVGFCLYKGLDPFSTISWAIGVYLIICSLHFIHILIESYKSIFFIVVACFGILGAIQYFQILDITTYTQYLLYGIYQIPWLVVIYIAILIGLIKLTKTYYLNRMNLDELLQVKIEKASNLKMDFLDHFGTYSSFLKNDILLIIRNKRARTTVFMSLLFMFYGFLILRPNASGEYPAFMLIFVAFFVSGGFLMMFGQYVPSWDSSYYSFMMTQNITYKNYLKSKWLIICMGTCISMLGCLLYINTSMELVYLILATGVFNIGINAYIVLWGGAFLKSPVDLTANKNVFGDKNAFNLKVMLISLPKLILPFIIYYIGDIIMGFWAGLGLLTLTGLIGIFFQNAAFKRIEKLYKKEKYSTIQAFKSK
ncbi:DUF5687 family protein [Myroides sp. LJL119]